MSEVIIVALIVGVTGVLTPALLAYLGGRQRRADKQEDWARQDAVAEQAASAALLLLAANERVASATRSTNDKLDVIHTLVNSNMTAAMQAELTAVEAQHAVLLEVIALKEASGASAAESRSTVAALQGRIGELRATLTDRLEQTRVANLQAVVQVHTHVTETDRDENLAAPPVA